jgi:hypothetical protein
VELLILPGLACVFAAFCGAMGRREGWNDRWTVAGGVAWVAAVVIFAYGARGEGVRDAAFLQGLGLAAVALGLVPYLAYFALGHVLARYPVVLTAVGALLFFGVVFYLFIAWFLVARLVACGPDAYECPV